MNKFLKYCLLFVWINISLFAFSFTNAKDYEYKNLDIVADVKIDWTIDVTEEFTTNFFVNKHWIIRTIPLNYSVWWKDFHINLSNINVRLDNFSVSNNNWVCEIKIWDANKTIIWEHIYPISYSVYWLIRNFSWMWYSELYWNLVWYDFDTNIDKVKAVINLPLNVEWFKKEDIQITTNWKTTSINDFEWKVDLSNHSKIVITYDKKLSPYQGITLWVKFPNNYFVFDHDKQAALIWRVWWGIKSELFDMLDFMSRKLPVWFLFVVLIVAAFSKNKPTIKKSHLETQLNDENPIVVRYSPPEWVSCAEAWMLYDCLLQPTDLTCLLYKWAIDWLISIKFGDWNEISKTKWFIMTKLKDIDDSYPQYEIDFYDSLFWKRSINSQKSVSTVDDFDVVWSLKSLRNYGKSKWWVRIWDFEDYKNYIWVWLWVLVCLIFFHMWFDPGPSIFIPLFIIAIFCSDSGSYPTQKRIYLTDAWKKITSELLWYAEFIKACDENKLRLFLEKDPAFFDKTLPYAVAFWFETTFIRKMTPILMELDVKPTWFDWDVSETDSIAQITRASIWAHELREQKRREMERRSSYSSDSWFSSWSSFSSWWFSSWWWGGWWGSSSW